MDIINIQSYLLTINPKKISGRQNYQPSLVIFNVCPHLPPKHNNFAMRRDSPEATPLCYKARERETERAREREGWWVMLSLCCHVPQSIGK